MNLKDPPRHAMHDADDEWLFVYEWFAGWRWEHHQRGTLVSESLESFQSEEECVANASLYGYAPAVGRHTLAQEAEQDAFDLVTG